MEPPQLSEDAAWLPPWLQPPSAIQSPPSEEVGRFQHSISTIENGNFSDHGRCKTFQFLLSGEDNFPSCSTDHEVQYRLHLSSNGESQWSLNPILIKSQSEISQAPVVQRPEVKSIPDEATPELGLSSHESPKSKDQKGINAKVDAKSRKVSMNNAVELAVAASEALIIHDLVKDEPSMELSFASSVLEAAIRVKQARLKDSEETHCSIVEERNEIEFDSLSDLDELTMADAYEDVGLTVSGHGDLSGYGSMSHVKDSYASGNYVSNTKQKCIEHGGLEVGSSSVSPKQHYERVNYERPGTENLDLACDIDHVFSCSVEQTNIRTTEAGFERVDFAIGDQPSSKTILRSSLQSGTSGYIEREDKMASLVPDRFQSRWFGGWAWKNEASAPAVAENKCRKNIPELVPNEISSLSESADIAPDMNSCVQRQDKECESVSQSSVAPEIAHVESSNHENLLSEDVEVTPIGSPMDPLCSVVPCSFTSDSVVSRNCNHQVNLEKQFGPTAELTLNNRQQVLPQSERRSTSNVNGECSPTIRRHAASLKTYSMLPRCDPYIDTERTHGDSLPSQHSQSVEGDTELTSQMLKDMNLIMTTNNEKTTRCLSPDIGGEENPEQYVVSDSNVELLEPTIRLYRKVESNFKGYIVPRRKRVHFSDCEINYPQAKKFKKTTQIKLKDPIVAKRIFRGLRRSRLQPKSRSHEVEKHGVTDKKRLLQDLKFLVTGFSVQKHKQIMSLIQENGGIVLDDFPSPSTSRGNRSLKSKSQLLPLILCPRRLLTTKFLYGCAVNACIIKVKWLFDSVDEGLILPPDEYMVLKEHATEDCMVIGKPVSRTHFIFGNIAIMLHGKPDFCSKIAKVIKHGGGLVFKKIHWLVKSLESKKVSLGAIVVEDENGISRQLKQCALEEKIPMLPLSWIINSLYAGKLLPSPNLKLPDCPAHMELSEEI